MEFLISPWKSYTSVICTVVHVFDVIEQQFVTAAVDFLMSSLTKRG